MVGLVTVEGKRTVRCGTRSLDVSLLSARAAMKSWGIGVFRRAETMDEWTMPAK